jgi:dihydroorotase
VFEQMTNSKTFILKGGRVVDPAGKIDAIMDVGVSDGKIVNAQSIRGAEEINVSGKVITPGLIDVHVHLRDPGQTASETMASGTMAAAAGGFTTVVSMPNTKPVADSTGTIDNIRRKISESAVIKVLPSGAMTKGLAGEEMSAIGSLHSAGIVALTDDGKCIQNHSLMRNIVRYAKSFQLPIMDHCEEYSLVNGGVMHEGVWSTLLGMTGIASASEELIVDRNIIIARDEDWKIHCQHISARESVEKLRAAQANGIKISAEATPHHICFTDEEIKHFDSDFKMNPPLRAEDDRLALIEGLKDGTISIIASDHAPHTHTSKLVEFDYAPFGVVGLETSLSVCLTMLYHSGEMSLSSVIEKMTCNPAEFLGIDAGTLREGAAADITVIDLDQEYTVDKSKFKSLSRNTPFHGMKVKGKVAATICDGKFVYIAE